VSINVRKNSSAATATLRLTAADPDFQDESHLYINGNGPIELFGSSASVAYDDIEGTFEFEMPARWWRDGSNELNFIHRHSKGSLIIGASVRFDGEVVLQPETDSPFPIAIRSFRRDQTVSVSGNKITGASEGLLYLTAKDADYANESLLYINGNGPIELFGVYASSDLNEKIESFVISTPADWWEDGENQLRFIHNRTWGSEILEAELDFR